MSLAARRILMTLLLVAAAGFVSLGLWQVGRLRERRAANLVTAAARQAPPVVLTPMTAAIPRLAERRIVAHGRYDHARDIILRGAVLQGVPGVRLVTPLLLSEGGPAVLVDRGFLPAPDALTVDATGAAEPGEVEVSGIALPMPAGGGEPLEAAGRLTWRRLDLEALRTRLPYEVLPVFVRQSADSAAPSFPRRTAPPPIGGGPHAAYAVQWFLFAGMAVAFAMLVVRQRGAGHLN